MENELIKKLEIVKKNISGLVDYLDENRLMESTPDQVWEYILAIERAVEPEEVTLERLEKRIKELENKVSVFGSFTDEAVTLEEVYNKYFK
jgi:CII-binding regulator of phage lambda lysogenization HflD